MSEVQAEVQAPSEEIEMQEKTQENTTQENTLATPQQEITQYQQQQQQVVESVEPNVIVMIHLPDINRDLEIGRYAVKSAWINVKASPIKGGIVYKLKLYCNGIEHSFEALSIFIEFKDKVIFRLTR
jgi:hypothetical protein